MPLKSINHISRNKLGFYFILECPSSTKDVSQKFIARFTITASILIKASFIKYLVTGKFIVGTYYCSFFILYDDYFLKASFT